MQLVALRTSDVDGFMRSGQRPGLPVSHGSGSAASDSGAHDPYPDGFSGVA